MPLAGHERVGTWDLVATAAHQNLEGNRADLIALASLREERLNDGQQIALGKLKSSEEGTQQAQDLLAQNPYEPGTEGAKAWVNKVRLSVPYSPQVNSLFNAEDRLHENASRNLEPVYGKGIARHDTAD